MAENKIEYVGRVAMDYSFYPGEDFYSDGAIEDEMLRLAKTLSPVEYPKTIEEKESWPILYHMSDQRENIVEWLPIKKKDKVLEVGSGCGAITGVLSQKAGSVTCVDLSKKRSLINANRHSECENVTICVGNFKDIEPTLPTDYDYVLLIGVFEYGQSYIGGSTPYEDFLTILKKHVAPKGRIIIAIENRLGLKYLAGCKEDHLGTYFSGIENYRAEDYVRTFSRPGLEKIFDACGMTNRHFYYPYPDYKFMTQIYSDAYLPGTGEMITNIRNFDRDRMVLFDEAKAFDSIAQDGLFSVFSNSYLVVLGDDFDVKYAKYSNDRAQEYKISTRIFRYPDGRRCVRKYPLNEAAVEHILGLQGAYEGLVERYEGGNLAINRCKVCDEGEIYAEFEFVNGVPLSELMDRCLANRDMEGFQELFLQYLERVGYNSEAQVCDYDVIFSNILVDGDKWTLIDYEWTFGKQIDVKEIAFRAVYCYLLENEQREALPLEWILDTLQISEEEAAGYREAEASFQKFVTGERKSLGEMRELIGGKLHEPQKWIDSYKNLDAIRRVQVYEDRGSGCSEENSYFIPDAFREEDVIEADVMFDRMVKILRIDPYMDYCVVKITECLLNGVPVAFDKKLLLANGRICPMKKDEDGYIRPTVVFDTFDPNLNFDFSQTALEAENELHLVMEVTRLKEDVAKDLAKSVKKLF